LKEVLVVRAGLRTVWYIKQVEKQGAARMRTWKDWD